MKKIVLATCLAALASLLTVQTADAANVYWNGGNANFADAANWSETPGNGDVLYFGANGYPLNVTATLSETLNVRALRMADTNDSVAELTIAAGGNLITSNAENDVFIGGGNGNTFSKLTIANGGSATLWSPQFVVNGGSRAELNIEEGAVLNLRHRNENARMGSGGIFTLNQTGGLIDNRAFIYASDANGSTTVFNLSGGKFDTYDYNIMFGTRGAVTMNISGDHEFTLHDRTLILTGGRTSNTGTINQSGGVFSALGGEGIWVGEQGSATTGTYNLSGGVLNLKQFAQRGGGRGFMNISGTGTANIGLLGAGTVTSVTGGLLNAALISGNVTQTSGVINPGGLNALGLTEVGGTLTIKEDRTLQTTNIALHKPASQVSTLASYAAGYATDGNIPGNDSGFSHTNNASGQDQWWQVDLGNPYLVGSVRIYNRYGGGARLTNSGSGYYFELYDGTLDNPGTLVWTSPRYDSWGDPYVDLNFGYDLARPQGNVLRLVRDFTGTSGIGGDEQTLNLKEVEVYNYLSLPVLQFDLASGNRSDLIRVLDGGTLNIEDGILEVAFLDGNIVEGKWQLFEFENSPASIRDILGNLSLDLPTIEGYAWNTDAFAAEGWISLGLGPSGPGDSAGVPEPSAWLLGLLAVGGAWFLRRNR